MHSSEKWLLRGSLRPGVSAAGVASLRVAVTAACAMLAVLLFVAPARACPNCAVGVQARAEVWSQDFWFNVTVAALPFVVIVCICTYVEKRERWRDAQGSVVGSQRSSQQLHA
jgi:hypothetical protein